MSSVFMVTRTMYTVCDVAIFKVFQLQRMLALPYIEMSLGCEAAVEYIGTRNGNRSWLMMS